MTSHGQLPDPPFAVSHPTLWAIITINFFIVQIAPGGPVDQAIAAIEFNQRGGMPGLATAEWAPAMPAPAQAISARVTIGGRGLDPEVIAEITHRYGFDKPLHERYLKMLSDYLRFDFGDSLFRSASVLQLIKDSLPVSVSLGLWSTLIIYLVSIPLGIRKAVSNGSRFDIWSSTDYHWLCDPCLSVRHPADRDFAGGSYFDSSLKSGLQISTRSPGIKDPRLPVEHHLAGAGDGNRRLCCADYADQKTASWTRSANSMWSLPAPKALVRNRSFWGHVFRNALLLVIAGFPAIFISDVLYRLVADRSDSSAKRPGSAGL